MEEYITYDLIHHIIGFQWVMLLIAVSNIWIIRRARHSYPFQPFPMVSILVPARNEESGIANCVQSLLDQDYPSFEVLVLDDQSIDNTNAILQGMVNQNAKLTVLAGKTAPREVVGKNWACVQLAEQAKGELFLFTDADTLHQPNSLQSIVTSLINENADLVTGFPGQQVHSWGERLLVPFFSWAMICFNSLWVAYRLRTPALSSAVGQMMLFRREAYHMIGGYEEVGKSMVDDLSIVRLIKSYGLRWRIVHISDIVSCRMYNNSQEAYHGFVKNMFAAFDYRLLAYIFVFAWLFIMFWVPIIILILMLFGMAPLAEPLDLSLCVGFSLILWLLPYLEIKVPFTLALLYPVTILVNIIIAVQSFRHTVGGNITWKERPITKKNWKWL